MARLLQSDTITLGIQIRDFTETGHVYTSLVPATLLQVISYLASQPEYTTAVAKAIATASAQAVPFPSDWAIDKPAFRAAVKYFQTTTKEITILLNITYTHSERSSARPSESPPRASTRTSQFSLSIASAYRPRLPSDMASHVGPSGSAGSAGSYQGSLQPNVPNLSKADHNTITTRLAAIIQEYQLV
jgi:hypothetical protein